MSDTSRLRPITSDFADDPEMKELVRLFAGELPDRVGAILSAWDARELILLRRIVHQLKGASAGYGYPAIGEAAKAVEDRLKEVSTADEAGWKSVRKQVDQLIDLCRRATLASDGR